MVYYNAILWLESYEIYQYAVLLSVAHYHVTKTPKERLPKIFYGELQNGIRSQAWQKIRDVDTLIASLNREKIQFTPLSEQIQQTTNECYIFFFIFSHKMLDSSCKWAP